MEVTIRASSLAGLFDCPAQWEAKHINKIYSPRSPRSLIGNAVHHSAEAYDKSRMTDGGVTINEAAMEAIAYINDYADEVQWIGMTRQEVESKAVALHQVYCAKVAPQFDYVAIEIRCEPVTKLVDGVWITLTGSPDRVYETMFGEFGGLDIKTGMAVLDAAGTVETVKHIAQMGIYEILIEEQYQAMDLKMSDPFVIAGLSTAGSNNAFGLGYIKNAKSHLLGDPETGQDGLLNYAARLLKSGLFFGNPNSRTCTKQYCPIYGNCKFRRN